MKMHDPDDKVIDFSKARDKKRKMVSHKKRGLIVVALLAAVIIFICTVLFFQAREVVDDKGFWQNFQSSQQ